MQISRFFLAASLLLVSGITSFAQEDRLDREKWIKTNFYYKQEAVDFIRTAYKEFTPLIKKGTSETGIYKQTVKLNDCELVIETERRVQESSFKVDHEFEKMVVIIELDKVKLEGNDIKPQTPENDGALFSGPSYVHSRKLASYSILSSIVNIDDPKFTKLHYEEHLRWAFEFLLEKCK